MSLSLRWIAFGAFILLAAVILWVPDQINACAELACLDGSGANLADKKTPTPTRKSTATPTPRPRNTPTPTPRPIAEEPVKAAPSPGVPPTDGFQAPPAPLAPFAFNENDCGPPAEEIPGPPPRLIVVGKPMSDSWLMCYIKQDFEGQDFHFKSWGEIRTTSFQGYPVECWNSEAEPWWGGRRTDGIVAQVYGTNRGGEQFVRFTYRIQQDGDYINNCRQEILMQPEGE